MEKRIVVTYSTEEEEKNLFQDSVADVAKVSFMEDVSGKNRPDILKKADVVVSLSFSSTEIAPHEVPLLAKAELVQLIFSGADDVPFHLIPEGTIVAGNPGAFAEPVAEHVLALVLSLAKCLHIKHDLLTRGVFDRSGFNTFLKGKTCSIIGLGGNGKAVARIMRAIGMKIWGITRSGETDEPIDFIGTSDDLQKVLEVSDVVVLTVPLSGKTRGLIGRRELGWMKDDAILINVARGAVVDQKALYDHLKTHLDFRAGVDTWWSEPEHQGGFSLAYPFFQLPNILGSPHVADAVPGMRLNAARRALENVNGYLSGRKIRGIVPREDYVA